MGTRHVEEWRAVVGFEGIYEVSNCGGVRRIKSTKGGGVGLLKPKFTRGYPAVALHKGDRTCRQCYVHRLVAEAFIGPSNGLTVNHIDGVRTNNSVENLEYATQTENVAHAVRTGLNPRGERQGSAKLTSTNIRDILAMKGKVKQDAIAEKYGVTQSVVSRVLNGKAWTHLTRAQEVCSG